MYSAQPSPAGLLDTNVIIHAYTTDAHSQECRRFLVALEQGRVEARLDSVILHELSYTLPRYLKQLTRDDIAAYLLMVLGWKGVRGDRSLMTHMVERWRTTPHLAFVDAYLAAVASRDNCPVLTKNVRELRGQGVTVPSPLPGSAPAA